MRFIDDDDTVKILAEAFEEFPAFEHPDRTEQMIMPIRFMVPDQQIAEVRISENRTISVESLFEDFLAVRGEQKSGAQTKAI